MFKNNLTVAVRNLKRHKAYGLLNILGIGSGLLVFLLIMSYVRYEFSYDAYHENANEIYHVYKSVNGLDIEYIDAATPGPLAPALVSEFPEVVNSARFIRYRRILMETEQLKFREPAVFAADPSVFQMFSVEAIEGNIEDFVKDRSSVALSETIALKYFGRTDVLGEIVQFAGQLPLKVSGVFKDMPGNTQMRLTVVANFEGVMSAFQERLDNWNNNPYFTYLQVSKGTDVKQLEAKLPDLRGKFANDPLDEDGQEYTYFLQPLTNVHFASDIQGIPGATADMDRMFTFVIIAIAVLLMSCINYINLVTARSVSRLKEVGLRKIVGAHRSNLIFQHLTESGLIVFLALVVAFGLLNMVLPAFSSYMDKPLHIGFGEARTWFFLLAIWAALTVSAGIYPALMTTSVTPLTMLRGQFSKGGARINFRNLLVGLQLVLSVAFIIAATTIGRQLSYIDNMDTGYTRDQVVNLRTSDDQIERKLKSYMDELSKVPGVAAVASSWSLPTNVTSNTEASWPGIEDRQRIPMYMLGVTHGFFDLFEIELAEGRFFDPEILEDRKGVILNETAVKSFGWEDPIGREMAISETKMGKVIGVVKDFHIKSLREEIQPLQIVLDRGYPIVSARISGDMNSTLAAMEAVYETFSPEDPFEYTFFKDKYDEQYANDRQTAQLTIALTVMAVLIACLGLYGLASYQVNHQMRVLGIRKVMGASASQIAGLLIKSFMILLIIALVISGPVAYWAMSGWLSDYAYHINLGVGSFAFTALLLIAVICISVGFHTYRAAVSNPVDSLRVEP